jgi:two-component system chemotaxis response regulator CheY
MPKTIALVGHCGVDAPQLASEITSAVGAKVLSCADEEELEEVADSGVDLLLLNRELPFGFDDEEGIDVIRRLHERHPHLKMMLVSDHADAQEEAVANGALPGFGKGEIGTPRVAQVLKDALS